tara:strand:- start:174 stop:860 length:687 start_codon:yes stop_codon:yes gene_type:complete
MIKDAVVVICARGGSKGLKNKNLTKLNGKPLIGYTIEQSIRCFENIVISSDSDEILDFSSQYKNVQILKRPKSLSGDKTPKIPAIQHAVKTLNMKEEIIIDLQPTSPLREDKTILKGIRKCKKLRKWDNLVSISLSKYHPKYNQIKINSNKIKLLDEPKKALTGRNLIEETYIINGSFYIWNKESLMKNDNSIIRQNSYYIITDLEESVDIDTKLDLEFAEYLIKSKK